MNKKVFRSIDEVEAHFLPELHRRKRIERLPEHLRILVDLFGLDRCEELAREELVKNPLRALASA